MREKGSSEIKESHGNHDRPDSTASPLTATSSATDGDKIGGIGQIYLDDNTGEPKWVTVKTGLFGTSESFVPLDGASLSGGDIVVKYDKATVKDAPRVDADGNITPEEEEALYSYYGARRQQRWLHHRSRQRRDRHH